MAHQYECMQDGCEFMVRANDEDEVVQMTREHAQNKHGMSVDADDIRGGMRQV